VSEQPSECVIAVSGLSRRFRRKPALDGAELSVRRGTVHGLVGENGAGKTTLIKHLLGTLKAKEGTVRVFGKDPTRDQVAVLSEIGYLSEDRDMPGWMRVRELLSYTEAFYPNWDESYAGNLLQRFRLDPEALIKHMSRGEKAKVGLVCALAYRPRLLVLDEPSTGLDVATRRDILWAIVRTVAEEGRTVLFSSHLLEEVERTADTVTLLHQGRTLLAGPLDELKQNRPMLEIGFETTLDRLPPLPTTLHEEGHGREWRVLLGAPPGPAFRDALAAAGGRVLDERPATLEELFLAETGHVPVSDGA